MNGTENQIDWATQIISSFVAKCETIIIPEMETEIAKYGARAAKTGRDFSPQIEEINSEIQSVRDSIKIAKAATDAAAIINMRHVLEDAKKTSDWPKDGLYNIEYVCK